ncbi:MAG: hypothetical protein ACRC1G_12460 [Bradyrhizobium sp.]|nr:hypothetical protein [Bradyrhizobium sp.]
MKPAARRRVERQITGLMAEDGDRCSECKTPFPHNSRTFGGVTAGGSAALVGECCRSKLKETVLSGVYVDNRYQGLPFGVGDNQRQAPLTSDEISQEIDAMQQTFKGIDQKTESIKAKGGVTGKRTQLNTADSVWKDDDAQWFKANRSRAHRLRAPFPGELEGRPESKAPAPAGHEYQMLVRQIESGVRLRLVFCRNVGVSLPDAEPLIHALFDVVAASEGGVVSSAQVAELAMRYAGAGGRN